MLHSGFIGLNFRRSGSGNSFPMAGGLHLAASSMSLETMSEPATPIPSPRAPAVSEAVFWLDNSLGDWDADSKKGHLSYNILVNVFIS